MKTTLKGCVVEKCIRISALFSAFERIFDKDYYFGGETHDFWELVCVVEGAIRVTAGEDIFMLEEGQAVLHSPMEFHSFWSEKGTMPHIIVVTFAADVMPALKERRFRLLEGEIEMRCGLLSESERIFGFEQEILVHQINAGREADAHLFVSGIENIILSACSRRGEGFTVIESAGAGNYRAIVRVLEEHMTERLSLQEVSQLCSMSESTIKKTFSRYAGIGMVEYFNQMKMRQAARLLEEGKSVGQAAEAVGFHDQNYFSTVFKRIVGMSPRAYLALRR